MGIDTEYQSFIGLPWVSFTRIERSVYNRRKRGLFLHRESLRNLLSKHVLSDTDSLIVDSMPLEICKLSIIFRSLICKEDYLIAPNKGYCASQKTHYYGYKLYAVCTIDGVFTDFDLSQASIHDIHYLKDIKQMYKNCTIIGDKGYLSIDYQRGLFTSNQIKLEVPMRKK